MQDVGDQAKRGSWVSSGSLGFGLGYQNGPAFKATFTYTPEFARYHSYRSENHVDHRAGLGLSGSAGRNVWEFNASLLKIDGSNQGPVFDVENGGDIPAVGGIPLRDRRDALVLRNGFKLTHNRGRWFLRPSFTAYLHDFRTQQRARTGPYAGYENYVDRYELNGGLDLGYRLGERAWAVAGHRYGRQEQGKLLGAESPYSNSYHRILLGLEGSPARWLRVNFLGGPDLRRFERRPAGFDREEMLWYLNGSLSLTPSAADTITAAISRYQQPAFSSHSVYEDLIYDFAWKRQHTKRLSSTAGMKIYGGDWQAPVNREDWIYTPSAAVSYAVHRHLTAEAAYLHDAVRSRVPNTQGRQFTRPLFVVSLGGIF